MGTDTMGERILCPDCGYSIALHFRAHDARYNGAYDGRPIGCPWIPLTRAPDPRPRVTLRRALRGPRKGHVIVAWVDCTEDRAVLVWDLDADDQWVEDVRRHQVSTRAIKGDEAERVRGLVEDRAGGPVRVVTKG